nr:hypothetical protein [Streptomyces violascens]
MVHEPGEALDEFLVLAVRVGVGVDIEEGLSDAGQIVVGEVA